MELCSKAVEPLPFRSEAGTFMIYFTRRYQGRRSLKAIPRRLRLAGAGPFSSWKVTQPSALIAKMVHDTGYALLEASQDFEALRQWRFG